MQRKSIIIGVLVAIVAISGLYFLSNNQGKKSSTHDSSEVDISMEDGMSSMPQVDPANFDSLLTAALLKISPSDNATFSQLITSLEATNEVVEQSEIYESLGLFWVKKNRRIAAHYFLQSGLLDLSERKLNYAAHLFTEELHDEQDPSLRTWMSTEAIEAYERSIEVNPHNDTVKIDYALLHIDILNQPMPGVQILLKIVEEDPNNIPANIILGKMAVESGQLDKAIERGLHLISLEPNNLEARLFLGEAYKRHNEKDKAIEQFTEAKKILNVPEFIKDIDDYIESFSN